MSVLNGILAFFQQGGVFMYPILVVLSLGLIISMERWLYITIATGRNRSTWNRLLPLLHAGRLSEARRQLEGSKSGIGRIVRYGLERLPSARSRSDIAVAMEQGMMEIVPRLEKRTHYLATLANIATLLGLLGTIIGLIQAFTAVGNANPSERAELLSASISVAMNTTAFGLMVGIPLLLIHALLQSKTIQLLDGLEAASVKVLNRLPPCPATEPRAAA